MEKTKKIKQMTDGMKDKYSKQGNKTYGDSAKLSTKEVSVRKRREQLNQW